MVKGLLLALTLKLTDDLGLLRIVYNHGSEGCVPVAGPETGTEDAAFLPDGSMLITSGIHIPMTGRATGEGGVWRLDPSSSPPQAEKVAIQYLPDDVTLLPAGISIFSDTSGTSVFVINSLDNSILKFNLEKGGSLSYEATYKDELIHTPNNLVALSHDEFYASNFFRFTHPAGQWVEEAILQLPLGSLVRCVRGSCLEAAGKLKGPNGLALSQDNKKLYVATVFSKELLVYAIRSDGTLSLETSVSLGSHGDNLSVTRDGDVLIGSSHKAGIFSAHMAFPAISAPSLILRVKFAADEPPRLSATLANDGSLISGSTVALELSENRLFVGTLQKSAFICRV